MAPRFPISSCGLLLEDEAVRVAVGLRLGAKICEPHACPCGANVDALGLHSLSCRRSSGRVSRHHNLNDIVWRALTRAGIPASKEPAGLSRTDGKRPDGLTLIPWISGKCAVWDVTVIDTFANSYLNVTSVTAGGAAELAATRKLEKYRDLARGYEVIPVAMETMGPMNPSGADFINGIGRQIRSTPVISARPPSFGRGSQFICKDLMRSAFAALLSYKISSSWATIQPFFIESIL